MRLIADQKVADEDAVTSGKVRSDAGRLRAGASGEGASRVALIGADLADERTTATEAGGGTRENLPERLEAALAGDERLAGVEVPHHRVEHGPLARPRGRGDWRR